MSTPAIVTTTKIGKWGSSAGIYLHRNWLTLLGRGIGIGNQLQVEVRSGEIVIRPVTVNAEQTNDSNQTSLNLD